MHNDWLQRTALRVAPSAARWVPVALVVANLAGLTAYLWWASHAWAIPAERAAGLVAVTGEPFVWALGVLPLWAAFGAVNVIWAIVVLLPPPRWRQAGAVLAVSIAWAVAVVIDFAYH